jgi:hypothetical protein
MSLDLAKLNPWWLLRMYAEESASKSGAPAIDLSSPLVDGSPTNDRLEFLTWLTQWTKGIAQDDLDITCIALLEPSSDRDGRVVVVMRDGELQPKDIDERQVVRLASKHLRRDVKPREVRQALSRAGARVEANIRRRIEAQMGRLE